MSEPALIRPATFDRRVVTERLSGNWHRIALAAVLGLAAFLNLWALDQNGWANEYYSAAVRSMLESWSNFFFVSFDPGGLVSVDKPPLALWLQAASAKIFGFSSLSILVPQALCGVAAVGVLYLLVRRTFGRIAGLVAALALAVSPVSVAVNRDNNPDALFALLLVLAAYAGVRAAESGRRRWLIATAVFVGLAFNTKMLAAAIVVPAAAVAYLALAPVPWRRRFADLFLAGVVLIVVSGAWVAAVELTPASDRPYVGSTSDNSALSLAFGYNGFGRVTGQEGGTSTQGGLGGAFSGTPGLLRLFNDALGDQGGWLIPLALVSVLSAALWCIVRRRRPEIAALTVLGGWFVVGAIVFSFSSGIIHTYYLSALAPATSGLIGIGAVSLWRDARAGGWRLILPAGALAATAWVEVEILERTADYLPWLRPLLIALTAVAIAALGALVLLRRWPALRRTTVSATTVGAGVAALLVAPAAWSATVLEDPVNGVFPGAGPNYISGLSDSAGQGFGRGGGGAPPSFGDGDGDGNGQPPGFGDGRPPSIGNGQPSFGGFGGRGPDGGGGDGPGFGGGSLDTETTAALLNYLRSNDPGTRFLLILQNEQQAAPLVIETGKAIASMGGFTGRETVLTADYLEQLVASGEARYFLIGGESRGRFGGNSEAVEAVSSVCAAMSATTWGGDDSTSGGQTLYDCKGLGDELAAAMS